VARSLLKEKGILTTPGDLFGRPGHFRIGCGGEAEKTAPALEALAAALSEPNGNGKPVP